MKIFVDSANLSEIEEALSRGFASGITTNPSLVALEERADFGRHVQKIVDLLKVRGSEVPLSVEIFARGTSQMIAQAEDFVQKFAYKNLYIKVPIGWDELQVIHELRRRDIRVNCTCCMALNQAVMAALAGANFVSFFYGRIRDIGYDAGSVVRATRDVFRQQGCSSEIIVGSIRHIHDVNEALQAGADIITVPPKFFRQMVSHPKTSEAVEQFMADAESWTMGLEAHEAPDVAKQLLSVGA